MPTFLPDKDSPIYDGPDVLDLARNENFGASNAKDMVNGAALYPSPPSRPLNETFDESSTDSTQISDDTDNNPTPTNGSASIPPSMNSLPDGQPRQDAAVTGTIDTSLSHDEGKQNGGIPTSMRMHLQMQEEEYVANGVKDAAGSPTSPTDSVPARTSLGSAATGSIQQSPVELYPKQFKTTNRMDGSAGALGIVPIGAPETSLVTPNSSLSLAPPSPDPSYRRNSSPHRFSSPPLYPSVGGTPTASTSATPLTATAGALKHRHTLEVPKLQPGRDSKDGHDSAFASGRFSPTTAVAGVRRGSLNLVRRHTRSMQSDLPRDEIQLDEDARRWTEAVRHKRASKRRRKEEEIDDDRVLVGTRVDENHTNWVTAYNMLTGIRVSVSRNNAKVDRVLTNDDFTSKQKSTFDIAGNELVPSAKYDFKFKDYAPWVFRHLRAQFRLDPADYLMSLTGKYILSELGSPGKSGSFFYFSRDYKYIIKTIHHAEHKFLRRILNEYYQHVTHNPNTLLSQFYGLHRVKMPYGKKIHFVVMNNLFPPHRDIHQTFDLKGSTVGREFKEEDLKNHPRATLKDLNWLRRKKHLELGIQKKQMFLEQLHRDVTLLKRLQIMDYSLLIGIHDLRRGNDENLRDKTLQVFHPGAERQQDESQDVPSVLLRTPSKLENARKARELRQMIRHERPIPMGKATSKMPDELEEGQGRPGFVFNQDEGGFRATHEDNSPADEVYYLGVIDCLTHYNIIKKVENFWKGLSNDRTQISALPPDQYGERFYHFIEGTTLSAEETERESKANEDAAVTGLAEKGRVSSWNSSSRRRSTAATIPPMPNHQPPPPPSQKSPKAQVILDKASQEVRRSEKDGAREEDVPDRTLVPIRLVPGEKVEAGMHSHQHDSVLPVVEEAAEAALAIDQVRDEGPSFRPKTPLKDGAEGIVTTTKEVGPPTPPKGNYLKPESADSGYGILGNGAIDSRDNSLRLKQRYSRESLYKELPPLPGTEGERVVGLDPS